MENTHSGWQIFHKEDIDGATENAVPILSWFLENTTTTVPAPFFSWAPPRPETSCLIDQAFVTQPVLRTTWMKLSRIFAPCFQLLSLVTERKAPISFLKFHLQKGAHKKALVKTSSECYSKPVRCLFIINHQIPDTPLLSSFFFILKWVCNYSRLWDVIAFSDLVGSYIKRHIT